MSVFLVFTSEVDQVHGAEGDFGVPASHAHRSPVWMSRWSCSGGYRLRIMLPVGTGRLLHLICATNR
jgi:hypothetical protein